MGGFSKRISGSTVARSLLMMVAVLMASWLVACSVPGQQPAKTVAWPEKDVTLIVPFKPGGGFDLTARIVAPFLEKYASKKVNFVIKNVDGASGKIGLQEVLDAKPDGYTIGIFDPVQLGTLQVLGSLGQTDMSKMSWIGQLDWGAGLVALGAGGKFKTMAEMKGQEVRFAVTGQAGFSAVMVGRALGATPRVIVYNSSPDACLAAQRGDADATVFTWPSLIKQVNASEGKLVPLFLGADARDSHLPNIPSSAELGVKLDGTVLGAAHILSGPPGMSPELIKIMTDILKKAVADPDFVAQMEKAGYPPVPLFDKALNDTIANVAKVMEANKDVVKSLAQ
jgi:tripartite-type tricarboxylate transporter receptor subunit TctC